jgi:hypothetical protein
MTLGDFGVVGKFGDRVFVCLVASSVDRVMVNIFHCDETILKLN